MTKLITYRRFTRKIVFLITLLISFMFFIFGYLIQYQSIKENLQNDSSVIVDLIFENLYSSMRNGATKNDLDLVVQNFSNIMPNSSITIHTQKNQVLDENTLKVFQTKKTAFANNYNQIDFLKPILFKSECIKCHTENKPNEVAGVIKLNVSIFDLNLTFKDALTLLTVLFIISIIVLFITWNFIASKVFIDPIKALIKEMTHIANHKDLNKNIFIETSIQEIKEIENVFNTQNKNLLLAYKELEASSFMDSLTKIYNRKKFDESISIELYKSDRYANELSIILIDLNGFKLVNDTYGHDVGDKVLVTFTTNVSLVIRESDMFFRTGGDEFVMILPHTNTLGASQMVAKIEDQLNTINNENKASNIVISASFGIAQYNIDGTDALTLLKIADAKMYEDKKRKKILPTII